MGELGVGRRIADVALDLDLEQFIAERELERLADPVGGEEAQRVSLTEELSDLAGEEREKAGRRGGASRGAARRVPARPPRPSTRAPPSRATSAASPATSACRRAHRASASRAAWPGRGCRSTHDVC
jgi:hypothetical protein